MHDHTEPSQSAQGGNYGLGMMSGMHFIGDRNTTGGVTTFPNADLVIMVLIQLDLQQVHDMLHEMSQLNRQQLRQSTSANLINPEII